MRYFELRDHTADVAVEARGDTLGEAFAAVAEGLTAAMCDEIPEDNHERVPVTVHAESREALLFDYLDEIIYERDAREVLPADHEAQVHRDEEWVLEGSFRAIPFPEVVARDVKAVTYSEMRIEQGDDGWEAYVVFDV